VSPGPLRSKLPDVGTTIFTVMSRLAAERGALNLSQGFPDFDPPAALVESVVAHLRGGANQYAPMAGLPVLREAIAAKAAVLHGRTVDPETEVTVTSGATEALFCALQALAGPGDEVILLDPAYDSYEVAVRLAGARPVRVPLRRPDFAVDWERVAAALGPRTRAICVNSPHNPTGAVLSAGDLDALAAVLRDRDVYIVADEVYEHMVFDGCEHLSVLSRPDLYVRACVVSSFGKTCHATGWKVGYCVAPPELSREFRKVHQFVQFAVATPLQAGLADFLVAYPEHATALPGFYARKRDLFCAELAQTPLRFRPSAGTYFQLVDYSAVSDLPDTEFARWLTCEIGVAAVPVSVFSAAPPPRERIVRFCFAKHDATLLEAGRRLRQLVPSTEGAGA
jgi:methionine aminotransferase